MMCKEGLAQKKSQHCVNLKKSMGLIWELICIKTPIAKIKVHSMSGQLGNMTVQLRTVCQDKPETLSCALGMRGNRLQYQLTCKENTTLHLKH